MRLFHLKHGNCTRSCKVKKGLYKSVCTKKEVKGKGRIKKSICGRKFHLMILYIIFPFYLNFPVEFLFAFSKTSVLISVYCIMYFFPRMTFSSISSVLQAVPKKKSFHQPWWQTLVNTSLISQIQENISSFSFLAKTLSLMTKFPIVGSGRIQVFPHCPQNWLLP